ncbi:hypothetical protein [Pyrobaculum sp.]|uniref:hypothetical protein n=1 Tax=Pyrobaculum sp. TaxID=2004705 RepID=UPI003D1224E3
MPSVVEVIGPHAYTLAKYGVLPSDDVKAAVEKLRIKAPHLAALLEEVSRL